MPEPKLSLHRKLAQILYEAERIPKRGKAPSAMGGYPFVQVGDAADYIRKALGAALVTMMPTKVTITGQVDRPTKAGGSMTTVDLIVDWTFTDGESGETFTIQSFGAGADGGDKYSGKATTSAMKYAFLSGFLLSTGEDTELGSHEATAPVPGAPAIASDRRTHTGHRDGNPGAAGDRETGEVRDEPFEATVEGKVTYSNKAPVDGNFRQTPAGLMWGFVVEAEDKKRLQVVAGGGLAEALQLAVRVEALKGAWVTVHGLVEGVPWEKDGKKMPPYQRMALRRIETPEFTLPAPVPLSQELADAEAAADMLWAERQPEEGA